MRLELKDYQKRARETLREYLGKVVGYVQAGEHDAAEKAMGGIKGADGVYGHVPGMPQWVPNVCFKIPTGGGKTILGIECIEVVAKTLQGREGAVVLWMAPTEKIVEQTLKAMKTPRHPYCEALPENTKVVDLGEAYELRPADFGTTVVIVTTGQALRVKNKEGRKIYEAGSYGESYGITKPVWEVNAGNEECMLASLANVIRSRRPLVLIDEAHKGRNELLAETLTRFEPCCILEMTATPEKNAGNEKGVFASNVLYRVSAAELKKDSMIKLPIHLRGDGDARELLRQAMACRNELEEKAKGGKRYIRPVMLLQAQANTGAGSMTPEVVKGWLVGEMKVRAEEVAVCALDVDELKDRDLLKPSCEVRYVITIDKLREGWDCPFAYVLYTVSNVATATAVEQIIGRVLRMPYAEKPADGMLCEAYAYINKERVSDTAGQLAELLAKTLGYDQKEMSKNIYAEEKVLFPGGPLFDRPVELPTVKLAEPVAALTPEMEPVVKLGDGGKRLEWVVGRAMKEAERAELITRVKSEKNREAVRELFWATQRLGGREAMRVPQLMAVVEGEAELFEDQFKPLDWRIGGADALMTEKEFPRVVKERSGERIDMSEGGRVVLETERVNVFAPVQTLFDPGPKNEKELVRFLVDGVAREEEMAQELFEEDLLTYLRRVVTGLIERGYGEAEICLRRYELLGCVLKRVAMEGFDARKARFAEFLMDPKLLTVTPGNAFSFTPDHAPYTMEYDGRRKFKKHFYDECGFMNGEEAECAHLLDEHPLVRRWVRNPDRMIGGNGFWLQTSTDRFYPDFVAELEDGRWLVVEYKGEDRRDSKDSEEKGAIGNVWATRSGGKCLFLLVGKADMEGAIKGVY